jgi:hypothetical protein
VHQQWLVDGRATLFNYIDNLLAYTLGAGRGAGSRPRVQWSADRRTLIYRTHQLPVPQLRQFVEEVCDAAETLLCGELIFTLGPVAGGLALDLRGLVDDMNETAVGYSFVSDARNGLGGGGARAL